jgi:hypothetical protein
METYSPMPKRRPDLHPNASRHLILGNGAAVRKQARREYDQVRRKLDQARQELDRFKTEDRPAFETWMNRNFGQDLTKLNELAKLQQDTAHLMIEVEHLSFSKGISLGDAYRLALHRRAHPEETPPPMADPKAEEEFKKFAQDYADRRSNNPAPGARSRGIESDEIGVTARVKDLYRILARKLHPDSQEKMTPQKLEWWHEVQEAYVQVDVARMEHILTQCELQDDLSATHTSVSRLHRLTAQFKISLRAVKRELTGCRRERAWKFTQTGEHAQIAKRIRAELDAEASRLCEIISAAKDLFRLWEREATKLAKPARRKRKTGGNNSLVDEGFLF